MPLRCLDEYGATIEANACTDHEWTALRERARAERHLKMPCCPAGVVLKESKLGTRFFAHKTKGGCTWKPETEVHLQLKQLAVHAAREARWEAQTEVSGSTGGERWTADVLAWTGDEKIAVEIQWSGQTNQETWRRQRQYQRSGVKGIWLLRQPGFPISEQLAGACIGGSLKDGLRILLPKWEDGTARHRNEDWRWLQIIEPAQFMRAVFENRFLFGIAHVNQVDLNIETGVIDCWKCGSATRIVTWLTGQIGPHEVRYDLDLVDEVPVLAQLVQGAVEHRQDIGTIKPRFSKTVQGSYLSNGCARCDALIGRFYEHEAWYCNNENVGTIQWKLDPQAKAMLNAETRRWGVWERRSNLL